MKLTLRRRVDYYSNKKYYEVKVLKTIDAPNARPVADGKDRHKALKHFEELKKQYPNIETEKDIDKKQWEK